MLVDLRPRFNLTTTQKKETTMRKYGWLSLLLATMLFLVLTASVMAQNTVIDDEPETATLSPSIVQIQPVTTTLRQRLPVSVTLLIPIGPTETQTVTVPMLLSLNLQLGFGEMITTSLALTAEIDSLTPLTSTASLTPTVSTPTASAPTAIAPTATPLPATFTPTALPPTATAIPATATPVPTNTPEADTPEELAPTEPLTATEPITETVTETETESVESEETDTLVIVPECGDPRSTIVFPGVNQVLSGTVDVIGSANHENFSYFKLEYANGADAGAAAEYFYLGGGNNQVENGWLATVDTQSLNNGVYTMRLTVVDNTGNFPPPCSVTVEIAN
jgi:hypothetical protein